MWKSNSAICWLSVIWISTVASGPTCSTGCQDEQPSRGVFKLPATLNNHRQLGLGGQQQHVFPGRRLSQSLPAAHAARPGCSITACSCWLPWGPSDNTGCLCEQHWRLQPADCLASHAAQAAGTHGSAAACYN